MGAGISFSCSVCGRSNAGSGAGGRSRIPAIGARTECNLMGRSVNCINCFWYCTIVGAALWVASLVNVHMGLFWAIVVAIVIALVSPLIVNSCLAALTWALDRTVPTFPTCEKGVCDRTRYEWTGNDANGGDMFRCKCGQIYVRRGRQFMKLLENGTATPFRIRNMLGRWKRDDAAK